MPKQVLKVKKKPKWYERLVEDIKRIIKEENLSTIMIKHKLGSRILEERGNIPWGQIFNFMKDISKEVDYSWRELYYCSEFASRYPNLEEAMKEIDTLCQKQGVSLTWRNIRNYILREKLEELKEMVEKLVECDLCGKEFSPEETKPIRLCRECSSDFITYANLKRIKSEAP